VSEFTRQLIDVSARMRVVAEDIADRLGGDPCKAAHTGHLTASEHAVVHALWDHVAMLREVARAVDRVSAPGVPMTKDLVRVIHEHALKAYDDGMALLESLWSRERVPGNAPSCPRSLN
jgi:hypothetical protein